MPKILLRTAFVPNLRLSQEVIVAMVGRCVFLFPRKGKKMIDERCQFQLPCHKLRNPW